MWKNFFFFSKGQRIGIIVLFVLIVLVVIATYLLPRFSTPKVEDATDFLREAKEFKESLIAKDSLRKATEITSNTFSKKESEKYTLFRFNPNTADSLAFVRLGLRPYVASNILKYRNKGGKFKTPEDFGKIYGISEEKFAELKPYINIPKEEEKKSAIVTEDTTRKQIKEKDEPKKEPVVQLVELNVADTVELMQIRGIGKYYANMIVQYRRQLGGYVSVEQLLEIKNMRPETYEQIQSKLTINVEKIRKIDVNTASVDKLRTHPYLNFYQAKAIYDLRRKKGKLKSVTELQNLPEFSPEQVEKIKPYLSFEN